MLLARSTLYNIIYTLDGDDEAPNVNDKHNKNLYILTNSKSDIKYTKTTVLVRS